MSRSSHAGFSRRERQIMDIVYRQGQATAADVRKDLPDPPSYSAVRAMLPGPGGEGIFAPRATRPALCFSADLVFRESRPLSAQASCTDIF